MVERRLRLKSDADPIAGTSRLSEVIVAGGNDSAHGAGLDGLGRIRDDFLTWIEQVESALHNLTHDPDVVE